MKRVLIHTIVCVVSISILVPPISISANTTEDEQWTSPFTATAGLHGIELMEVSGARTNVSLLTTQVATGEKLCSSVNDAHCSGNVNFQSVLAPCTASNTIDCIASVTATDASGAQSVAEFSRFFPAVGANEFEGSATQFIPSGRAPGLWTLANAPHSGGSLYHVSVQLGGARTAGSTTTNPRSVSANISPVSVFQTSCNEQSNGTCMDKYIEASAPDGQTTVNFQGVAADQDEGIRCVGWGENSVCALKHAFPVGIRYEITLRLSQSPGGWLHGRMSDPIASLTTESGITTMVVNAAPTKVPAVGAVGQWSVLPSSIQQWFSANCPSRCGTRIGGSLSLPNDQRNAVSTPEAYREESFSQLALWTNYIGDKASALPSYWSVRTLSNAEMNQAPTCIRNGKGVTGIVSTNATLYSEGPPSFNTSTKTLNYKVAAPHYEKDGSTLFLGRYDLLLRPDIASCLYGIDDLAVTSAVQVVGEGGVAQSASTSMLRSSEWFKFSASGYTHSAPTITVKLEKLRPTLKRGKTLKVSTLAKRVGLKIPKGAKLSVSVAKSSRSRCSVARNSIVKGVKKGTCTMSVTITPKKTKKVPKPKAVKRTVAVTIS